MKKIAVAIAAGILMMCSFLNPALAQEKKAQWAEWKAFHAVMSTTFHPSEEGNFEPIRTRSGELVTKAEEWLKSTAPKEFDKPEVKELLTKLRDESIALDKQVKAKASDEELKAALSKLHDRFHSVVGACSNEDKGHGEHENHEGHKH